MPQQIALNDKNFEFTIKKNRLSKRVRILIHSDGRVVVSAPRFVSQKYIKNFLMEKSDWINSVLAKCAPREHKKISPNDFQQAKKSALKIVKEKIQHFSEIYNLHPKKIFIRNQSTRWGSCSGHGNLSFNYRLIYLPDELVDYLIVHELCHLREMNHSLKFWSLVAREIPDYINKKTALRSEGRRLM